jgi:hypothetical protein
MQILKRYHSKKQMPLKQVSDLLDVPVAELQL